MNQRTIELKKAGLATAGYNFTPHCGLNERARRLRQIVSGRLPVSAEEREKTQQLFDEWVNEMAAKAKAEGEVAE